MSEDTLMKESLSDEKLEELEDVFPASYPPDKCRICGNRKIYKNDSIGPVCKKCANGCNRVPIKAEPKIPRNSLCPCGSGKKFKKCCM